MARELIIIGAGPAGWTAALYATRAEIGTLLFEGPQPGGQLTITSEVENYPGFPKGIMGPELMEQFKEQAKRFGTEVVSENVTSVDFSARPFKVSTAKQMYEAEAVIVATGASAMWLGIPGEERLMGKGVSACATCDGFFFKGKDVVVVGGGDSAAEESTFLTKFVNKVYLLVRKEEMKASKIMQQRVLSNPKIQVFFNTEVTEIAGENHVESVNIVNNKTEETSVLSVQGYFAAIGHKPNTDLFRGQLELDVKGYLVLKPGSSATAIPGVFAAGDVSDHVYRQAVTAAGMGCMAAMDVERWLTSQKEKTH